MGSDAVPPNISDYVRLIIKYKRGKNMKKLVSIVLAGLLLWNFSYPVAALNRDIPLQGDTAYQDIFIYDNTLSYYERTEQWTINAIVNDDGSVVFCVAYCDVPEAYTVVLTQDEFAESQTNMTSLEFWNAIREIAFSHIDIRPTDEISAADSFDNNASSSYTILTNTNSMLYNQMVNLYGSEVDSHWTGGGGTGNIQVNVYDYFNITVRYSHERTSHAGDTLQVFATALGVPYPLVGILLGLTVAMVVPTGTGVLVYDCIATYGREGRIAGTSYYGTFHDFYHFGVDNANGTDDPVLQTTPYEETYTPSQSAFTSVSSIVNATIYNYNHS